MSKIATGEAKPNNQLLIENGAERSFLAPLSVRKIPMIGSKDLSDVAGAGRAGDKDHTGNAGGDDGERAGQERPHHLETRPWD